MSIMPKWLVPEGVKYNRGSEKNIENCFFHINLRPGAWTSCNKGIMQKLKRHGNGGSCFKQHEQLKIKIFAERVMESHNHLKRRHYRVFSPTDYLFVFYKLLLRFMIIQFNIDIWINQQSQELVPREYITFAVTDCINNINFHYY
jgi:hypothetical protein